MNASGRPHRIASSHNQPDKCERGRLGAQNFRSRIENRIKNYLNYFVSVFFSLSRERQLVRARSTDKMQIGRGERWGRGGAAAGLHRPKVDRTRSTRPQTLDLFII
jgi:hypothetical protein